MLANEKEKRDERNAKGLGFRCDEIDEQPDPGSFPKSVDRLFRMAPLFGAALNGQRLRD